MVRIQGRELQIISNNAIPQIYGPDDLQSPMSPYAVALLQGPGIRIRTPGTTNTPSGTTRLYKVGLDNSVLAALAFLGFDIGSGDGGDSEDDEPVRRWLPGTNVTFRTGENPFDTYIDSDPGVATLNGVAGAVRLLDHWGTELDANPTNHTIRLDDPLPVEVRDFFTANLLAPVHQVETNTPRVVEFAVGDYGVANALLVFEGNPTNGHNRLEARIGTNDWTAWNDCWFESAVYGSRERNECYIIDAAPGAHYRLVAEGGIPDRTNAALLASAPIYLGEAFVPGNRLATMDDVERAVANGASTVKTPMVARRAYRDAMNPFPTNGIAWNFSNDGVYIADLSVGGWTEETSTVTTNEGVVATNTVTVTNSGSLTLNGETIRSWAEIARYADGAEITIAPDGGGGAWTPASRVVAATNTTVFASDYLIWMDSEAAEDEQVLYLPDMEADSQSIVIRHLGGDHPTTIVRATAAGTNTYTLAGDGAAVAVDWLGIKTNWYWRQAY